MDPRDLAEDVSHAESFPGALEPAATQSDEFSEDVRAPMAVRLDLKLLRSEVQAPPVEVRGRLAYAVKCFRQPRSVIQHNPSFDGVQERVVEQNWLR